MLLSHLPYVCICFDLYLFRLGGSVEPQKIHMAVISGQHAELHLQDARLAWMKQL